MSAIHQPKAPPGRHISAQGNALGKSPIKKPSSPEGARQVSKLPRGWRRLALGEVGRWFGGGTPSKANPLFWTNGNIPWVSPKDMKCALITDSQDHITEDAVAQSATNLVEAGSVLIVVRSGILQHTLPVAVAQRQVALNQDLKAVKPRENVRSDYLALALKSFERDILHTCTKTGTTVQSLELPVFLRFEIPIAPLPEQRRIVAEIEKQFTRLEAGLAALRRVQANLKRYRAAVLKAACEGRLVPTEAELTAKNAKSTKAKTDSLSAFSAVNTPPYETGQALLARILTGRRKNWTGRGKYKGPTAPDTAKLPPLPEGWTWATFGQLCLVQGGFAFKSSDYVKEGVPLVRISNLVNGRVQVAEDTVFLPQSLAESNRDFLLRRGDVLIAMSGATTGKMATMEEDIPALLNQRVGRCMLSSAELSNAKFISFLVMQISAKVLKNAYGAAQPNISPSEIEEMPVPLPPLAEQTRIVAEVERRLSVVEEMEAVVRASLQRAVRLRQSILQKAFKGQL